MKSLILLPALLFAALAAATQVRLTVQFRSNNRIQSAVRNTRTHPLIARELDGQSWLDKYRAWMTHSKELRLTNIRPLPSRNEKGIKETFEDMVTIIKSYEELGPMDPDPKLPSDDEGRVSRRRMLRMKGVGAFVAWTEDCREPATYPGLTFWSAERNC
ncbi:hypothetical protein K461DRAFT_296529 [Myriangium duriaei CBS 260.36]|uniref:Uncharacterized protein n=1 Tax=Myriangium duriaei CBS 260.36 TaxID=1168546 RepID=A0A9P4IYH2_9PEZI|nr:hypothetical protein K461DRAFT_296529 [Myriangium duriaei CBS 260.36]